MFKSILFAASSILIIGCASHIAKPKHTTKSVPSVSQSVSASSSSSISQEQSEEETRINKERSDLTIKIMRAIISDPPAVYQEYCGEKVLPRVLIFASGLANMSEEVLVEFEKYNPDYRAVRNEAMIKLTNILTVCADIQEIDGKI